MPLARIDLPPGKGPACRSAVGNIVYQAMIGALNVPKDDRFQVIVEHGPSELVIDSDYLGIHRTAEAIIIQITLNEGRTLEVKKAFYKAGELVLRQRRGPVRTLKRDLLRASSESGSASGHRP